MKITDKPEMPAHEIIVENLQVLRPVDDEMIKLLENTAVECLKLAGINMGCEMSLLLVDDSRIQEINREFRNTDAATDVLSFPIVDMKEGNIISAEGDFDPEENLLLLGDVVISLERAGRQAEEYGHSCARELAFLTTHGVFHLLGFDHMNADEEGKMLGKQEEVLAKMGLARK